MDCDYEELYKWVGEHTITRPKRNINRDFSDALPLVEILKHHYPKLVDLHNYSAKNSYALKITNWETVNNKILKKLKITLSKKRIDQLAKSEVGAIEKLLIEVKKVIDNKDETIDVSGDINISEVSINSMNMHKKQSISIVTLDKMKKDIQEKADTINKLKSKVEHYETLLKTKDDRINDLTQQLQTLVNQSTTSIGDSQSKPFYKIFN